MHIGACWLEIDLLISVKYLKWQMCKFSTKIKEENK